MVKVLFVCTGNICRSPTAEGVFRKLVEQAGQEGRIDIASAGTGAWHVGQSPDERSQEAARARGIDLSTIRARQVTNGDFDNFDYILAMDQGNFERLADLCPPDFDKRLTMFLDFAAGFDQTDVPDPYYGGEHGFELVLDMIEAASQGLLDDIQEKHLS